jgi:hypothetical protein
MCAMEMKNCPDNFDRILLSDGNLLGSACIFCRQFIAFCENDEQLCKAELAHTCSERARNA